MRFLKPRRLVVFAFTCFGAFALWFAVSHPALHGEEPATTGIEQRAQTADVLTTFYVDQESRAMIGAADLVLASTGKGTVQVTPAVALRERLLETRSKAKPLDLSSVKTTLEFRNEFANALTQKPRFDALVSEFPAAAKLRRHVVVFGGNGHDIIQLGPDGDYARGGGSSDHFVLEAGNILPDKIQRFRGDDGWDTAVLATGFTLKDVIKRTSPYQVRDPLTGGMYELDVEALGVVDNLRDEDLAPFRNATGPFNELFKRAVSAAYASDSSKHYSSSTTKLEAAGIYPAERRLLANENVRAFIAKSQPVAQLAGTGPITQRPLELPPSSIAKIALTHETRPVVSPFGGYPVIFSIENGFFAVSSERPIDESVLRNSIQSATISVSSSSLADSQVRVRLLTEEEVTLRGDLADPAGLEKVLAHLKSEAFIAAYSYRPDRTIAVTLPEGVEIILKPTLFVTRTGWTFPEPVIQRLVTPKGKIAFAVVSPDGFAQSFVEVQRSAANSGAEPKDFLSMAIDKKVVRTLASATSSDDVAARELVPALESRLVEYAPRSENQYPFAAHIDGGLMFLMAEAPLEKSSLTASIENASVSISSLFYARRNALLMMSNGDRIFSQAALMDPKRTVAALDGLQESGAFSSYRLSKELLGPLALTFASGRTAKMMPILFASPAEKRPDVSHIVEVPDGRGRFAFVIIGVEGYSQVAVDIGGSTIFPALPKP
jgi:hypothetical protein